MLLCINLLPTSILHPHICWYDVLTSYLLATHWLLTIYLNVRAGCARLFCDDCQLDIRWGGLCASIQQRLLGGSFIASGSILLLL
jgi:hypothetical protein